MSLLYHILLLEEPVSIANLEKKSAIFNMCATSKLAIQTILELDPLFKSRIKLMLLLSPCCSKRSTANNANKNYKLD